MNIQAAVARAHGAPLVIEGLVLEAPRDDEIIVRLVASGVASVDHEAIVGCLAMPLPFVPGSEGAGIVEHVGAAVTGLKAGDAVLVGYAFCGACAPCDAASPRACVDFAALNKGGRRADGSTPFAVAENGPPGPINGFFFGQSSFATHLLCRTASAIKLPLGAPLEVLACLGGELLLGAAMISEAFEVQSGDTLVITGADAVGLVACMVAKARGAGTIVVADPDEARRHLALDCGATLAVNLDADLAMTVHSMVADGMRFALDTTGHSVAIAACLESLSSNGICALLRAPDDRDIETGGRTLLMPGDVKAAPDSLIPDLAALQADGKLPLDRLISFFPFELVNDALEALATGAVVKPVLRFPLGSFGDLDRALTEGAAREAGGPEADRPEADRPEVVDIDPVETVAPPTAPVEV